MTAVDNSRPPYISFERRPIEDRNASIAEGRWIARDVDFVTVTRAGSRDTLDKEAEIWIREQNERARNGLIPPEWAKHFENAYRLWKEGETVPDSGTPIKGWSIISPAMQETLVHSGIRTVEDLAIIGQSELMHVGMGAIGLQQKAQAYLDTAKDRGVIAEEVAGMKQKIADLTELVGRLIEQNKALSTKAQKEPAI